VILAVGIVGNVENIGLEAAGVKVEKTHVVANKWGETACRASMPSAISSGRPGSRTRACMKA
jgi:dihydrolipoamide dehydrogenase